MKLIKMKILGLLLVISTFSSGQIINNLFIDSVANKIESLLPKNWFLSKNENGFSVSYCRSCSEFESKKLKKMKASETTQKIASVYFKQHGADSVSYYSLISLPLIHFPWDTIHPPSAWDKSKLREIYKPNDIVIINVLFKARWTKEHLDTVKAHNEVLRHIRMKESIGKKQDSYKSKDFRSWTRHEDWNGKTKNYPFTIEQLPYESAWYNYSIFITPGRNCSYGGIMYYDKNDIEFYANPENEITHEFDMVRLIISYGLGIRDYSTN